MTELYGDAEARRAANHFSENHFEAHRGAMPWETLGVSVVFGNDGFATDSKTKREVELVRAALSYLGIAELGLGVSDEDASTWALLAQTDLHERLSKLVWLAHERSNAEDAGTPIPDDVVEDIITRSARELVDPPVGISAFRYVQQRIAEASMAGTAS
jgi:hypothetical protein